MPGDLGLDGRGRLYNERGRGINVSTPHAGEAATVMFVFSADGLAYDRHDVEGQKKIVADTYAGAGWPAPRLMAAMADAADFYFDSIGLVRMDRCTKGRVALLGDAGYGATCGGMGAGTAMVSSYILQPDDDQGRQRHHAPGLPALTWAVPPGSPTGRHRGGAPSEYPVGPRPAAAETCRRPPSGVRAGGGPRVEHGPDRP